MAQGTIPDAPTLTDVVPPSAARGETVEVTLTGTRLAGTKDLLCRFSAFPSLITPVDRGLKAAVSAATDGQVKAKITVPADAPPGLHEIRAESAQGITLPAYFFVSQYGQAPEKEPNNSAREANPITIPTTVAGVINGGEDHDVFSFAAKKGQRLVFDVEGFKRYAPPQNNMEGVSYLDSFIVLRDEAGKELAYDDDSSRVDAFLAYEFAADGKYTITIRDTLYRSRGDFHYRLTVGNRPTITAVFPPGGPAGKRANVTVYGYNLDSSGATSLKRFVDMEANPGAQEFRLVTASGMSNAVPLMAETLVDALEVEPNDRMQDATQVQVPVICNGKFDKMTDVDGYRFQGQGGQRLVFSITASRLGSPVDTYLTVADRAGKVIARDDDGGGMPDARLEVTIPQTEEYVVYVRNQVRSGAGPQQFYRLAIRPLQPSFGLTLRQEGVNRLGAPTQVPVDSVTVPQGGDIEFEVALNRNEGQSGDIALAINAPPTIKGFVLEQLIKKTEPDPTGGPPKVVKVTVEKVPVIKNGQNTAAMRISVPETMAPGTYLGMYLKATGVAGAQPFVLNKPLWVTVAPKS
ncbi:MAG: hypothetical protein K0Q72_1211 [Armatimonadetes bacterium]|jgi:hypothetical protein|nr:hypothetical protein [Armatimonadota bacterium]